MELALEKTQKCSFGTLVGCEEAVGITLPGSKGHQDSTLSQHETERNRKDKTCTMKNTGRRKLNMDTGGALYLTEVDEDGAQGTVHSVKAVARVGCPHFLHPLEQQQ